MEIKGVAKFIKREKVKPPKDGVHVAGKDGWLKGSHAVELDGKLIPKGRVGLYVQKTKRTGVKIFYSLAWKKAQKKKYVIKIFKKWKKLSDVGVAPKPLKIVAAKINLLFKNTRHHSDAYGIKTQHIDTPEKAWYDYMYGKPYDWNAVDHPDHSPEGYLKFVRWAKRTQKKHGVSTEGSYKIGDVMWSIEKKRWYLVDID